MALKRRVKELLREARSGTEHVQQARGWEQEFLDIAGVMLMALDPKGRVTLMNKKGYAVLGYEEGELIGTHWISMCVPSRIRGEMELVWQGLISGEGEPVEHYEHPVLTKQGEKRIIAWHNAAMRDDAGTVTGVLCSGEDITERKKAQEALRESEARYRSLFENSFEAILLTSPDGRIFAANPEACRLLGWKEEELVRIGRKGIVDVTDARLALALRERELTGRAKGKMTFRRKDGTRFEGAFSSVVFEDRNGELRASMVIRDITEPDRVMEALREYKKVVEGWQDLVCVLDRNYRYLLVTAIYAKYRGTSKEHIVGRSCVEILGMDVFEQTVKKNLDRCLEGEALQYEMKSTFPGLGERDLSVSYFPVAGTQGVKGVAAVIRDITEHKKSEEALQESEEKFRLLFEKSADPVLLMYGYTYVDCNEAALKLIGCSKKDQLVGLSALDISPEYQPDGRLSSEKAQGIRAATISMGVNHFEWMQRAFDGKEFWVDVSQTVIPIRGRQIKYTVWRDISERKRAEEALKESEERYRITIESSNDGVAITREGLHVYVNRRFLEIFGYGKAEEVLGKPVGDTVHPEDRQRVIERNLKRQTGEVPPSRAEFAGIRSDGSRIHLEGSACGITYGGGPATLVYLRDITDRKRVEAQLRDSRQRLRALAAHLQAIREEERARVAREIHDELGQALTCMKIDLWEIREESSLGLVDKDAVLQKIEGLLSFIDATVDTVRRIASDLRPSILDDLGLIAAIEWQLSDFQRRTGIICAFKKPRSLAIDKDYSSALFRVFQESLTNIARHSEAEKVEITLRKTKGELVLAIRDNGKGIRENEVSGAASLGILGMRERVLPFDGHIQITGKAGKGTRVTVRIPSPGRATKSRKGDIGGAYDQGFDSR